MDKIEIAEAECPSCSPDEPTTHVVLKKGGLVKCEECGYVHAIPVRKRRLVRLRVVVSRQDKSSTQYIEVDESDMIRVGDEFVVESADEVSGVRVQSIETKTKARPDKAVAGDIDALWARTIDEVVAKIAVQHGPTTESINYKIAGDHEFEVGGTIRLQGYDVYITSIKTRDGGHAKREGQFVRAKDVKRIYSKIISTHPRAGRSGGGFRLRSRKAYRGTGSDDT
ncbi:MAG TPA: HVO_0476 family zinc finger protein [Methanocella sp.]|nr:HVO_0476 family zinc finger protein [Methanocella sp.]